MALVILGFTATNLCICIHVFVVIRAQIVLEFADALKHLFPAGLGR